MSASSCQVVLSTTDFSSLHSLAVLDASWGVSLFPFAWSPLFSRQTFFRLVLLFLIIPGSPAWQVVNLQFAHPGMVAGVLKSFCLLFLPRQLFTGLDQECGLCCFPPEQKYSEAGVPWLVERYRLVLRGAWGQAGGTEEGNIFIGWERWQPRSDKHSFSKCTKLPKTPTGGNSVPNILLWGGVNCLDGYTRVLAAEHCSACACAHNLNTLLSPFHGRLPSPQAYWIPGAQCGGIAACT